jgi:hypothetical protein
MAFFRLHRRFRLALLFASLFCFAVLSQLGVGWYQRQATARQRLRDGVDQIRRELRYSTRWDLTRFRQSDLAVVHFYIIDKSDVLIEVEGFITELGFRADLHDLQPGLQTVTVPITNETWRLMLSPLRGGAVILGISPPEDLTRVDERLQENAKRFGKSLEEAEGTSPSNIDRFIDHAILDDQGRVKFALGSLPLKLLAYPKLPYDKIEEIHTSKGSIFGLLSVPFNDPSGQNVGTVTVFHELSPLPWLSLHAWLLN